MIQYDIKNMRDTEQRGSSLAGNPCPEINLRTEIENFHKIFWSMQLVELNKSTYQYGFIDIKSEEKGKIFCFKILTATKIKIYLR